LKNEKDYAQPFNVVFATILDMIELQNGKETFSDSPHGRVHFRISMYGFKWEMKFSVTNTGSGSHVHLEIDGEQSDRDRILEQEFALLDSMLLGIKTTRPENA